MQLNFSAPKELAKRIKATKPEGTSLSAHIKKLVEGGLDGFFGFSSKKKK